MTRVAIVGFGTLVVLACAMLSSGHEDTPTIWVVLMTIPLLGISAMLVGLAWLRR